MILTVTRRVKEKINTRLHYRRRKLERIQEWDLRIVLGDKSVTYEELLKKAGLTTLYNRKLQNIAIMMYKVKHKLLPAVFIT